MLLNVVSYCDLSVLSMSVMGFPKIVWIGLWGELYPVLVLFFNFTKPFSAQCVMYE